MPLRMRTDIARVVALFPFALLFAGCQTPSSYKWGATNDPDWSGRVGTARIAEVQRTLGAPREKLVNNAGETKARWAGQAVTMNRDPGSMEDYSIQRTEERPLWHDMLFDKDGVLLRAWLSDQRSLSDSEAP
jgi:hypothetical protein